MSKTILMIACCSGIFRPAYAQTSLISASDGGFENATSTLAANGWTVVDGTSITWFTGTAAGAATGTKAAFVGSSSTTYIGSSASVIKHFYRDIAIPAGATSVFLNYKLKMPIVDCCTYDYFRIYTNTTAQTPVAGTLPAGTQRAVYNTPALANFTAQPQIDLTSLAGTTVRLVFTYQTDAASPYANPAVDDITLTYIPAAAGCTNTTLYPSSSFAAPAPGAGAYTIATNQYQSEYNSMTGAVAGHTFTSTGSIAGTYITVRAGTYNGTLVASGTTPLNWTAAAGGNYFIHYNTNSSCGTASTGMTTTITNTSPAPLPGENCANAQNLALLTSPYSATTVGYADDISTCRTGYGDRIFYISVPNGSTLTIGESTNNYDEWEYVGYGATCPGTTTINCWDNDALTQTVWNNNTGSAQTVWYIQDGYSGTGTFTLQWSITSPPACAGAPTAPTDGATGIAAAGTTLTWPAVSGATGYDVYFGTTNPAPTLVSSNQAGTTYATGVLSGSTTYYWRIVPRNAVGPATGCTNWSFVTAAGAPANDNCASAIAIASLPYTSAVINNALATDDYAALSSCDGPYKNVWWTVTGICGTMTAITCTGGTNFDDEIAIYTGSCGSFTPVTCNDDNGAGCTSNYAGASWTATAGTTYYISVGSYFSSGTTGNLQLNVTATPFTASVAPTGISGITTVCAGGSTTLTATGGTLGTGATIEWFTGSCGGAPVGTGASISVTPGTTTTYYVRYNGTCNTTTCVSTTVTVTPLPTVSISPSTAAICPGGSTTLTATGAPDNSLANVLNAINANAAALQGSIPTPFAFAMDGGVNGTNISDGGLDMYDGGNFLNTNLASAISYSDNVILASSSFGSGGQYFTRYLAGSGGTGSLFFCSADINGLSTMSITGNNGADGSGTQDTYSFTVSAGGVTYTAFLKRVYNAGDPSINQLFLIPQPNSASQTIGTTTDDSQQNITGLTGVTRVYYMLYAGASGAFINNTQATSIAQNFVNILPIGSYSWSPGGATTAAITVSPGSTTTYTVTYSSQGCSNTATREVTVNTPPTVDCGSYGPLGCTDVITLGGSPTGGVWTGIGVSGSGPYTFSASAGTQLLTYTYTDGNGCSNSCTTTVTVGAAPTVTCGGPYGPYCSNDPDVVLNGSANGIDQGTWSGTGVTGNTFDPSAGTQTLTYSYTDGGGCSGSCQVTITVNPSPVMSCGGPYGPYCSDAADVTLNGTADGIDQGTWSGTGVTGNTFDPSAGTQTLTYSYTTPAGCTADCQVTITVNPAPVISCGGPYGPYCDNDADVTLNGTANGIDQGTWSGTGVTGNTFDPGAGTQTLTYSFTDGNGCAGSCTVNITVNSAPTIVSTTATPSTLCYGGNSQLQVNTPVPASYCASTHSSGCSGDNITNVSLNTLSNATGAACGGASHYTYFNGGGAQTTTLVAGNSYTLSCSFGTDPNQYFGAWIDYNNDGTLAATEVLGLSTNAGSSGTIGVTFTVPTGAFNGVLRLRIVGGNDSPVLATQACGASSSTWGETQDYDVTITGGLNAYTYAWLPATFLSNTAIANPVATAITGTTTYTATVTNALNCSATGTATVNVNPLPTATLNGNGPFCASGAPQLTGTLTGTGPWSITYTTNGGSPTTVNGLSSPFTIDPSGPITSTTTYAITAISDANCAATSFPADVSVTVNPLPTITCPADITGICSSDAAFALTGGSPAGGTYSGTGVSSGNFDPAAAGAGVHTITYNYTDGNGCTNTPCTFTITVAQAVDLYADLDGDGFGDIEAAPIQGCAPLAGYATNNTDECDEDALKTTPGQCGCGVADTDSDGDLSADCIDGCPTDPNKVNPGTCGCGTPDADSDGDTYADCVDGCPTDPNKIAPGACGCGNADVDTDADGALDCVDGCPNDPNKLEAGACGCGNPEPSAACDDGNPNTINDVVNGSCQCVGMPVGNVLELTVVTDNNGGTSWEIGPIGGGTPLCSGSGYAPNSTNVASCTVPDGCYELRVFDQGGDGMCCMTGLGGYVLRTAAGLRIIDAAQQGIFAGTAEVASDLGFCLPLGTDRLTPSRCDREDYLPNEFLQAVPNALVQAQYGTGNQSDDGYQFWFFNPNGGYTRRILITHATNNYWFPVGADRCSYLKLDQVITNPLPQNMLLNVRVRSMVNSVYSAFGPACRFKIDLSTNCPTTQLVSTAGPQFSCGATGLLLNGSSTLYAVPVPSANRYQFEFSRPGYLRKIASSTASLTLTPWNTLPLEYNRTYSVRVRVSFDNGTSYCPFGSACSVSTAAPASFDGRAMAVVAGPQVRMWPNPNAEGRVHLGLSGLRDGANRVSVEIHDLTGATVHAETRDLDGAEQQLLIDLDDAIARGVYIVSVTANEDRFTERLVIQ
ncbi:MAG: GEVED domain-containing protein [Flavobacteriales bacterium]